MQPPSTPARPEHTPQSTSHLKILIVQEMSQHGENCSLNHIDVSNITDFRSLFEGTEFNGDISQWNVSQGRIFSRMFTKSAFNGDISNWDTSNAETMGQMFSLSSFSGDVSRWNVSGVKIAVGMFMGCPFAGDLSQWKFAPDAEHWGPVGLCGFVAHNKASARKQLLLPLLPVECNEIFSTPAAMHVWLAERLRQGDITRYHWDALLRDPESPWAPQEMAQFVRTYLSIAPPLPEAPDACVAQSSQLMHMWLSQHQMNYTLPLPSLEPTP